MSHSPRAVLAMLVVVLLASAGLTGAASAAAAWRVAEMLPGAQISSGHLRLETISEHATVTGRDGTAVPLAQATPRAGDTVTVTSTVAIGAQGDLLRATLRLDTAGLAPGVIPGPVTSVTLTAVGGHAFTVTPDDDAATAVATVTWVVPASGAVPPGSLTWTLAQDGGGWADRATVALPVVAAAPPMAPPTIGDLACAPHDQGGNQIVLTWSPPAGAAGWHLEHDLTGTWQRFTPHQGSAGTVRIHRHDLPGTTRTAGTIRVVTTVDGERVTAEAPIGVTGSVHGLRSLRCG